MVPHIDKPRLFNASEMDQTGPPQLGDRHPVYGEVVAIAWTGGERYYYFSGTGTVAMMPASALGAPYDSQR